MIRTVWLAIVCLALVSALAAGKALRTPAGPTAAEISADESTVGIADARDTLSKADRLEITYMRQETPPQAVLQSIEPTVPVVTPPNPSMETKIISRHWRDPNAVSSSLKDPNGPNPKRRAKMSIENAIKPGIGPNPLNR